MHAERQYSMLCLHLQYYTHPARFMLECFVFHAIAASLKHDAVPAHQIPCHALRPDIFNWFNSVFHQLKNASIQKGILPHWQNHAMAAPEESEIIVVQNSIFHGLVYVAHCLTELQ